MGLCGINIKKFLKVVFYCVILVCIGYDVSWFYDTVKTQYELELKTRAELERLAENGKKYEELRQGLAVLRAKEYVNRLLKEYEQRYKNQQRFERDNKEINFHRI